VFSGLMSSAASTTGCTPGMRMPMVPTNRIMPICSPAGRGPIH
jgi:hypothetical protein